MQSDNKFFDDLAKMGQSAAGTLHGIKSEVTGQFRAQLENILMDMDLVSREEFDVMKDMLLAEQEKVSTLEARLAKLEKKKK